MIFKTKFFPAESPPRGLCGTQSLLIKKLGIEGKVSVEFVINKNGNVLPETVRVVQSLFESCDREAVRVIQLSLRWKPGCLVSGEPSAQKWTMPIIFKL